MKWTLIKDELPEVRTKVLGYCRDITEEEKYYTWIVARLNLTSAGYVFVDFKGTGLENMGHNVIAWMPLPEPPHLKEINQSKNRFEINRHDASGRTREELDELIRQGFIDNEFDLMLPLNPIDSATRHIVEQTKIEYEVME